MRIILSIIVVLLLFSCSSAVFERLSVECSAALPPGALEHILGERFDQTALEIFVSPTGDNQASGSMDDPLGSLEGARDRIREMRDGSLIPPGAVIVYLREGTYRLDESFYLGEEDSGSPDSPIVYRGFASEKVVLSGGISLKPESFRAVSDPRVLSRLSTDAAPHILQLDLQEQGISDYGQIHKRGFGWPSVPIAPEFFIDGKAMTLARYPDRGFLEVGEILQEGFVPRTYEGDEISPEDFMSQEGPIFHFNKDVSERKELWLQEEEIWLSGYWRWEWADDNLKLRDMDAEQELFIADHPSYYGMNNEAKYYARNLLCELDRPGEWYLSRKEGILYVYPEKEIIQSRISLSILEAPMVFLDGASHIILGNLSFETSRGSAVKMMDGESNLIAACEFSLLGGKAVEIGDEESAFDRTLLIDSESGGGRNNGVVSSLIRHTGSGGISIMGGDRSLLIPAGNYAENNHICDFSRLVRTYSPAISLNGVGNRASHNEIHDAPHMAIHFRGNDLLMEYNEIYDVTYETSDVGVIYSPRDWTYRGNVIRRNYIHDISTVGGLGSYAIYLDDMMSSADIRENVFYNIDNYAFLIGGGRDNTIVDNLLINCHKSMIIDARAMGWASYTAEAPGGTCYVALQNVPVDSEVWKSRYPQLAELWLDEPKIPKGNVVKGNVLINSAKLEINKLAVEYGEIGENPRLKRTVNDMEELMKDYPSYDFESMGTLY